MKTEKIVYGDYFVMVYEMPDRLTNGPCSVPVGIPFFNVDWFYAQWPIKSSFKDLKERLETKIKTNTYFSTRKQYLVITCLSDDRTRFINELCFTI